MRTSALAAVAAAATVALGALLHVAPTTAEAHQAFVIPAPAADETARTGGMLQTAVFAGGCFWGVQGVFQRVQGVTQAVSGYAGGARETATYEMIGSGRTGHAEAVKVTYDPTKVSYAQLLHIFFSVVHDPTQLNRQDPDVGPQYRSAIFYADDAQKRTAERYIAQLDAAKAYADRVVTELAPLQAKPFYPAEEYHQDYLTLHPRQPYIATYDLPKIDNLQKLFPQAYRERPALVTAKAQALVGRAAP
jgi:peptide-methionine (S)-S-oxide reductase